MAGDHDDDPTQRKRRPRTPPLGMPLIVERQSRQMLAVTSDDDLDSQDEVPVASPDHPLEQRVASLERGRRRQRKLLWTVAGGAATAVFTVAAWALNAREQAGVDKERLRTLESEVRILRAAVFQPPSWPWGRGVRSDQPDPAPAPAPKGTEP